ncbi:MAG: triose-phosphate isomerase [Deltaproteobacteria bacterium CG_4_10_14_0_2_um_filter_43_8]|nr:MAG: triose-phosphate isomerase [Deltaproteobacteria bacterium CG_4_10_14_0_2_um_filter_43_8]PJC64080.1 MAG: triose-phosphate isomerase [Deltaproteobacteria bacterium CG_4_9_14_0_2_um_filter_42_21]
MRRPLIVANWKMNHTVVQSLAFAASLQHFIKAFGLSEVVIAPPFTALYSLGVVLGDTECKLGAQHVFWEESGAYTGEISAAFLKDLDVSYVIVGHSERREYFGETNETVAKRLHAALRERICPIVCIGEKEAEREAGETEDILASQLQGAFSVSDKNDFITEPGIAIAYEPIWAIGTGKTASPEQAEAAHAFIRAWLAKHKGQDVADRVRIIYGGSVKPSNSAELLAKPNIDGVLVGGASLEAESFAQIIRSSL